MTVTLVHVQVKPPHIDDFIEATRLNHENSVREPGNFRFDILQNADDPGKFVLYEVYDTEEAILAHKQTPHYLAWRDAVAQWMEKPRQGIVHRLLFPQTQRRS